ncbi:DNA-binding CsgD family transcriptional regulator [Arthrobacter sp. 1088]|uniref:helix-turn-helix transcriptional regulator n=1 Tax=Arthrobacter sp. 1088 TaxID=2817768 RepID=UPI002865EC85|nr:AAA family ATPase [Arthrobacter sp. 1088]MDR6685507.1 DNA-binding CsgD family transcriptional regulator [Arthrobacter sp. 1088]
MAIKANSKGTALVGREDELAELEGMIDAVRAGASRTVIVSGDAGVGKTALVGQICAAAGQDVVVLSGAALPLTSLKVPFQALRSAFHDAARLGRPAPFSSVAMVEARADNPLFVDEWLTRISHSRPVLLVIDDLQWSDAETLDILMFLIAGPPDRPLGIVATVRSGIAMENQPLERWMTDVRRLPTVELVTLQPLDRPATTTQISRLLGVPPPQSLVTDVYAHSAGNPYFTSLLIEGMRATGRRVDDGFPSDLRAAVLRSWKGLPKSVQRLTRILAVAGRSVAAAELRTVAGGTIARESVLPMLQTAVTAGIVDLLPEGTYWFHHPLIAEMLEQDMDGEERRYWHSAFADAYENSLSHGATPTSGMITSVAEHHYHAERWASAYQWTIRAATEHVRLGNWADALRMFRRALELKDKVGMVPETLHELWKQVRSAAFHSGNQKAELEALDSLIPLTDPTVDPLDMAALLVRRMHLSMSTGRSFFDLAEMERAVQLSAAHPQSWQHALALAEYTHAALWLDRDGGADGAARALSLARLTKNPTAMSYALTAAAMVELFAKHAEEAFRLAKSAAAEALLAGDYWGYLHAVAWLANSQESWISREYANVLHIAREELAKHDAPHPYISKIAADEAASFLGIGSWREAQTALRIAISLDPGPMGDVSARLTAARLDALQGRMEDAFVHLARAEEVNGNTEAYLNLNFAAIRSEVNALASRPEASLEAAMSGILRPGPPPTMCEWLLPLAARALADLVQKAKDEGKPIAGLLAEVVQLEERFPHVFNEPGEQSELYQRQVFAFGSLYAAELGRARGDHGNADVWIHTANACRDACLAWEQAYACQRAAEALLLQGHGAKAQASEVLRRGLQLARDLQAVPVQRLLEQLAEQARISLTPIAVPHPVGRKRDGLTAREATILDYVAAGRTYREIAESLVISEKTVSSHISSLLRKTGASNKFDLARRERKRTGG